LSAGKKYNCSVPVQGRSFMDEYDLTAAAAAALENVMIIPGANGADDKVLGWYNGSAGITESLYANLPKGSVLFDIQTTNIKIKTGARGTDSWEDAAVS